MNQEKKQHLILVLALCFSLISLFFINTMGCIMAMPPEGVLSKIKIDEEWAVRYGWGVSIIYPYGEYHSSGGLGWSGISLYRNVDGKWKHWVVLNKWVLENHAVPLTYFGKLIWTDDKYVYVGIREGDYFYPSEEEKYGWSVITVYQVDILEKMVVKRMKFSPQATPPVFYCKEGCLFERHGDNMMLIMLDERITEPHPYEGIKLTKIDVKLENRIMCSTLLKGIHVKYGEEKGEFRIYLDIIIDEKAINIKWMDPDNMDHEMRFNLDEIVYEDCTVEIPSKEKKGH